MDSGEPEWRVNNRSWRIATLQEHALLDLQARDLPDRCVPFRLNGPNGWRGAHSGQLDVMDHFDLAENKSIRI